MDILEAKKQVVEAGVQLVQRGLIARTWGNVSCRIDDETFVITPSGRDYMSLTPDEIVAVTIKDLSYTGSIKPSSEKGAHAQVYMRRPKVNFVIHTHQTQASVISSLGIPGFSAVSPAGDDAYVPVSGYGLPSTRRLARQISRTLAELTGSAMILKNHGALCFGEDATDAFAAAVWLERESSEFLTGLRKESPVVWNCDEDAVPNQVPEHWQLTYEMLQRTFPVMGIDNGDDCLNAAAAGHAVRPMVDDFAQIIGLSMPVVQSDFNSISRALMQNRCVLVEGVGAICSGDDQSDVDAMLMIASKTSRAHMFASLLGKPRPINSLESLLMNFIYKTKYSRQKDGGRDVEGK